VDVLQWGRGIPLWLDEEMIALNVRDRGLLDLAGPLWLAQTAPLGWLAAQRAALVTLGSDELVLRLLPLVYGIATLAVAAWVGRRWLPWPSATLFVLLCWIGPILSHYRFEAKHYSADVFWALLLPALAVRAMEAPGGRGRRTRIATWWAAAVLGLWTSNGAVFVAPACAVWLLAGGGRRAGVRDAVPWIVGALAWCASFAAHYWLSLRHAHQNSFLRTYWAGHLPPESLGPLGTAGWLFDVLEPLAYDPGGTTLAAGLWVAAITGWVLSPNRPLGLLFAAAPLTAFALAAARLVPLQGRVALWIVPAVYFGVACSVGGGLARVRRGWTRPAPAVLMAGIAAAALAAVVAASIVVRGWHDLDLGVPWSDNRAMDDRAAVGWLMERREPGVALVTTELGWPAMWWYGGISIATPPERPLPDGSAMYAIRHQPYAEACTGQFEATLRQHQRALVYLGFPDVPEGFEALLLGQLSRIGTITEYETFAASSVAFVVDLRRPPDGAAGEIPPGPALDGCVRIAPARRW
jgi:hypothetical protein